MKDLAWFEEYARNHKVLKPLTDEEWSDLADLLYAARDRAKKRDPVNVQPFKGYTDICDTCRHFDEANESRRCTMGSSVGFYGCYDW